MNLQVLLPQCSCKTRFRYWNQKHMQSALLLCKHKPAVSFEESSKVCQEHRYAWPTSKTFWLTLNWLGTKHVGWLRQGSLAEVNRGWSADYYLLLREGAEKSYFTCGICTWGRQNLHLLFNSKGSLLATLPHIFPGVEPFIIRSKQFSKRFNPGRWLSGCCTM